LLLRFVRFVRHISNISHSIQKICNDEMCRLGLRGSHVQYIAAIDRYEEGITAAKLCQVCERDKAAVSRALSELENKGLIRRIDNDNGTYRVRLVLTRKGKITAQYVKNRAMLAVQIAGNDFSEENRRVFYASLQTISENLRSISETGLPPE